MKYSSRFFLFAPLGLFLAIAAGVGVNWWIIADAMSHKLDAMNGRPCMPGVTLFFAAKHISGFPFNLDIVFSDFRLEVATGHGPSSWTAHDFAIHALSYGREQMIFEAAGRQFSTWTDLDGAHHAMPFEVGAWHASAIIDTDGLKRVDMDLIGFGSPALTAARVQLHARLGPKRNALDIVGEADAVQPSNASLFGDTIAKIRLIASATPSRAFDASRAGRMDWQGALENWRTGGGVLHIDDLELFWSGLRATGKGSLSLDGSHAVAGLLDFKIAGMQNLIEAAGRRHLRGGLNQGIAAALLDHAAKAGNNEAGLLGAVVAFDQGLVRVGDVPATSEEPLY